MIPASTTVSGYDPGTAGNLWHVMHNTAAGRRSFAQRSVTVRPGLIGASDNLVVWCPRDNPRREGESCRLTYTFTSMQKYWRNSMSTLTTAQRYFDAWNARDAEAIVATFSANGTYTDPLTGGKLSGPAIGEYAKGLWQAFPDLSFDLVRVGDMGGGAIAAQWQMQGTNTGPFQGLPPTARRVSLPGADFIEVDGDRIRSVTGYFDSRVVPDQLGLQVIVQPVAAGPFSFGTSTAVRSGRRAKPGAFSITQLNLSSDQDAEENQELGRAIAAEMMQMEGFIGWVGVAIGDRRITITAWEDADNPKQLLRRGTHTQAMKAFWSHLSRGGFTSVWVPERFNPTWVRCTSCRQMNDYDKQQGVCRCGIALPQPDPYW